MSFASVFSRPASLHRTLARLVRRSAFLVCVLLPGLLHAQAPGSRDFSFASDMNGTTTFAVTTQYDSFGIETIIYGGDQTQLNFTKADGTALGTFSATFGGLGRVVYTVAPELLTISGGANLHNVYLGGRFGKSIYLNPAPPAQNITRFTPTGVVDTAFQPGTGADADVLAILPLDNGGQGGLIAGGLFTTFNGQSFNRLVRLNENGSIDGNFQRINVTDAVFALAAQIDPATGATNGQVLVGGDFTTVNNGAYTKLFRMDEAGNIDTTFRPQIDSRVLAIAVQPDGKIVIGGQFSVVNGQSVGHLARLNEDGSLDPSFNASVGVLPTGTSAPVAAYTLRLLPDGRMYVGGQFYAVDGAPRRYLALINADGSLDASFDPGETITNSVQSVAVQADNRVLVAESFSKKEANGFPPSVIRLFGVTPLVLADAVALAATQPSARAGTSITRRNGMFEFTRSGGDASQPLSVYFTVSGTAQSGTVYKPLAATAVGGGVYRAAFAAGAGTLKLKVKPRDAVLAHARETVTLTLMPPPGEAAAYKIDGAPATVKIRSAR